MTPVEYASAIIAFTVVCFVIYDLYRKYRRKVEAKAALFPPPAPVATHLLQKMEESVDVAPGTYRLSCVGENKFVVQRYGRDIRSNPYEGWTNVTSLKGLTEKEAELFVRDEIDYQKHVETQRERDKAAIAANPPRTVPPYRTLENPVVVA